MKKALLLACVSLIVNFQFSVFNSAFAQGQKADSIVFASAHWHCDTTHGIRYLHYHFQNRQLFNSCQYFTVVEIPRGSSHRLRFVSDTVRATLSDFADRYQALAAINGSYFDMRTGIPVCYLRIDGKQVGINTPGRGNSPCRKYYQNAVIRLLHSGKPRFLIPDSLRMAESLLPDSNLMTAGPMLIRHGESCQQHVEKSFVGKRHNRSAIGLKPDGTVVLFVADGRMKGEADGLTLVELTLVLKWLGCCDAVNLDGGGSSTLYVRDYGHNGVINHPSDNGRFDPLGQRPIANAIIVL